MTDLTIGGVTQPVTEWALDYGLPPELIELRLEAGWTPRRAVTAMVPFDPKRRRDHFSLLRRTIAKQNGTWVSPKNKPHEINGECRTWNEWCAHFGIGYSTFMQRRHKGWSIEKALMTPVRAKQDS